MTTRKIIVGVDASPSSVNALRWACHNHRDGDEIVAILAWQQPLLSLIPPPPGAGALTDGSPGDTANEALRRAVADATTNFNIEITKVSTKGNAADAVLKAAKDADMVVVGTRGAGLTKVLLGSVSRKILHHAEIPVVVVPDGAPLADGGVIAVGMDGSDHSKAALRWARGLDVDRIDVIHTWHPMRSYAPDIPSISDSELEAMATETIGNAVADALEGQTDERLHVSVINGDARTILTALDEDCGLLVVGSRGTTGIMGALVGSVADYVVSHSAVAVAVI